MERRLYCREASQYWTPKPVRSPAVQLNEKYVTVGTKRISLEQLRKVPGNSRVEETSLP
jgi:hypothetical protein